MRWLLTSWGSRGDLHPFLALGRGLLSRGHTVSLVGHPEWQEECEAAGIRFVTTDEPPRGDLLSSHPEILSSRWGGLPSLRALIHLAIQPSFAPMMAKLVPEAREHDVIVAHHFVFPAPAAAELAGIPWATVSLAPGVVPSAFSLPGTHFTRAGRGLMGRLSNRLVWFCGRLCGRVMIDPVVNVMRRLHDLPPVRDAMFDAHSSQLNLQLYSAHFAPPPSDWTGEKQVTGFCYYDPPGAVLTPEIEAFLGKGEPPVLFTLGSTAVHNPGAFYQTAVEVCERLQKRAILLIGPEENRPATSSDTMLAVNYAPYGLLMSRVRAVVHQCGIGTLSHTLRAGVPSIAYPFAFDQPDNAGRLRDLGMAEVVLPRERDAVHMEAALQRLLAGSASERARRMSDVLRDEDGVAKACTALERTFGRKL